MAVKIFIFFVMLAVFLLGAELSRLEIVNVWSGLKQTIPTYIFAVVNQIPKTLLYSP